MREGVKCGYLTTLCALFILFGFSSACAKSIVIVRIVDAETGKPIKEAIIAYRWYKHKLGVPGLPTEDTTVDAGEEISGDDGTVKIPEYSTLLNSLKMVVYKKGYVCWSNLNIFPSFEQRKNFELEDGIIIRVEPFKQEYSKKRHADFVWYVSTGLPQGPRLGEALEEEMRLLLGR
jgi:hypothetical protein